MKVTVGILIVIAHAAGYLWLAARSGGTDLVVELRDPLSIEARVASDRVTITTDTRPGFQRRRWTVTYRGGFTREVGASQLVGPFQDPHAPACTGRVIVGQRMLDTMTPFVKTMIDRELHGLDIFPVGAYQRLDALSLEWARVESSPGDRRVLGKDDAPNGYVRAQATVVFERSKIALLVALIPERAPQSLKFRIAAIADLDFNNAALRWVSDKLGASSIATRVAREQIDDILVTTLAPPPPFELAGGQTLQFTYCDAPVEIVDGAYGALPFAVTIAPFAILPPRLGPSSRATPAADTTLALDLDADALNALLFELWRTGWLDRELAEAGLDRRFNSDPIVTEYLSIRLSPIRLALPPVIAPNGPGTLRLAADARVAIGDGTRATTGRVFGALDFRFARATGTDLPLSVELGALELACERSPTTLVPCYGELVAALRDRGAEFHGALTQAFAKLLAAIFVDRRIGVTGLPVELVIHAVVPSVSPGGTLHLQLDGELVPAK